MLGQLSTVDQNTRPDLNSPLPRPRRFRAEGRTVPAPHGQRDPIVAVLRDDDPATSPTRMPSWTFVSRTGAQTRLVLPGTSRVRASTFA